MSERKLKLPNPIREMDREAMLAQWSDEYSKLIVSQECGLETLAKKWVQKLRGSGFSMCLMQLPFITKKFSGSELMLANFLCSARIVLSNCIYQPDIGALSRVVLTMSG